jgi:hypothetical protein
MVAEFGSEDAAKWTALLIIGGIITYYETHGNKRFSSGIKDLASVIPGW